MDYAQITELRRKGLDKVAEVARYLGIPKGTLLNAQHGEAVREAMEHGRVLAKMDCLDEYRAAISGSNGNLTGLIIFKAKNIAGWTDRPSTEREIEVTEGARERVAQAVASLRAKYDVEGQPIQEAPEP